MKQRNTPHRLLALFSVGLPGLLFGIFLLHWLQAPPDVQADNPAFDVSVRFGLDDDYTSAVATGDLNGDGYLDIIVGNWDADENFTQPTRIYWNDGNDGFASFSTLGPGFSKTWSVVAADLDGDGDLDVIEGNTSYQSNPTYQQNKIYWNDGSGGFPSTTSLGNGTDFTRSMAAADLDGDGDLDIVVGNSGQNQIFLNDGSGVYGNPIDFGTGGDTRRVIPADLDGDGDLDIVEGNGFNEKSYIYWNDGSGGFTNTIAFSASSSTNSMAVADLNGDSYLDIIEGNNNYPSTIFWNDGSGGFPTSTDFTMLNDDSPVDMNVADLNGDGHLDILMGNGYGKLDHIYWNDGSGSFPTRTDVSPNDDTYGTVTADLNNDGYLDIVEGSFNEFNLIYYNDGSGGFDGITDFGTGSASLGAAAADLNGDGYLDIVEANNGSPNRIYWNNGDAVFTATTIFDPDPNETRSVAAADLNRDGHLDIIEANAGLQENRIYWNDGSSGFNTFTSFGATTVDNTGSIATADLNSDGYLDIIEGNSGHPNQIYWNDGSENFTNTTVFDPNNDKTTSVTPADLNGDGHLDIIVGNTNQNQIYWNDGSGGFPTSTNFGTGSDRIATADLNGDGYLDILVGNSGQNQIYWNDGSAGFSTSTNFDSYHSTIGIAATDFNGDGFLDILVGNRDGSNHIYWNDGQGDFTNSTRYDTGTLVSYALAADLNNDGYSDILLTQATTDTNKVFWNNLHSFRGYVNNATAITAARPVTTAAANFYSSPQMLTTPVITVPFTLTDPESDPIARIEAFYSQDGGQNWRVAVPVSPTNFTVPWATSPEGMTYYYPWDTVASGVYGRSDNVVLRFVAYPQPQAGTPAVAGSYLYTNSVASANQWTHVSATTFPFSLRGIQAQVVHTTISGTILAANALIYNLPAGATLGAQKLQDEIHPGLPQKTGGDGYYLGRPTFAVGDQLAALYPVPNNGGITFTDKISLYYTSAPVVADGLALQSVDETNLQVLTTTTENTLLVFNLDLSLEWDATNDPFYLTKLETDLNKASQLLFDWSNGQLALGQVRIYQAKEYWYYSDIVVHASNQYRPNATIGGIVTTTLGETLSTGQVITDVYRPGQIHMGANWNRFGQPGSGQVDDWAEALAHEIGHYAFFLQDNYFGIDTDGHFLVTDCQGSAMTNPYQTNYSEFLSWATWSGDCLNTLAQTTIGLPDWELMQRHWPQLAQNGGEAFSGPSQLPLALLEMRFVPPSTPPALADQIIELVDTNGNLLVDFGSQANAYLFKTHGTPSINDDRVVALGTTVGGSLTVRGLTPGDRLCLLDFTPGASRSGCADDVDETTQFLTITPLELWQPQVKVNTINTTTFQVSVTLDIPSAQALEDNLWVQVLPAASPGGIGTFPAPALAMRNRVTTTEAVIFGQVVSTTSKPVFNGYVRVWDPTAATAAKEIMTEFRLSGDWPVPRASGDGIVPRASGDGMAPVLSGDGQALLLSTDPVALFERSFRASLQTVSVLPDLPSWLTPVGNGYRFSLAAGQTLSEPYSIVIQYLQANVANALEPHLNIYYQAEGSQTWQLLPSFRDTQDNLISADVPDNAVNGQGIYALVTAVHAPALTPGWNELVFPLPGTQPITTALASLAGVATSVYGYDLVTFSWQLYDYTVLVEHPEFASLANDLETVQFGQSYWVYVTEPITPIIPVRGPQGIYEATATSGGSFLPATFYGWVTPTVGFTPQVGDTITARIGDVACGSGQVTNLGSQLAYVIQVRADVGNGCGRLGQIITFMVDGQTISNDSCWDNSQARYLDIGVEDVGESSCLAQSKLYLPFVAR